MEAYNDRRNSKGNSWRKEALKMESKKFKSSKEAAVVYDKGRADVIVPAMLTDKGRR